MQNASGKSGGQQKSKENLKSKLDGNELDLSLSSLEVVPVKELASIPKATCLDLSCNLLVSLGSDFCILTHLVKLDLSKNRLTSLPDDIGKLSRLQHLDLYNNSLTILPLSFSHLSALKWLDLRDNPLEPVLLKQAGECLNETQCRKCAKQVVDFMKNCASEAERIKQKRLQEERVKESARKLEEELERQRVQLAKKAERDRKKKEQAAARQSAAASGVKPGGSETNGNIAEASEDDSRTVSKASKRKKKGKGCCMWCFEGLFMVALFLAGVFVTVALYCWKYPESTECSIIYNDYWPTCVNFARHGLDRALNLTQFAYNRTVEALGNKS